jgi:diguanylate cyclase (GGDEF)-like protein
MNDNAINRRRIKVGLLVSHLEDDFDDSVCEGAMIGAEQADVNLVIFPGRYIDGVYADKLRTEYEYQYNTLFDIPCYNKFDVLLVLIGTIGSHLDKKHKAEFLKRYSGTPVITISAQIDRYPCISVDNKTGMVQAITHLIERHGCRNIGFVSGPATSEDAIERLQVYKETLIANGIEYDDKRVVYGNFSKYVTAEVETLLDRCGKLDAIVFANDQMAIAGYQVLESRGIRPGKDIYVTGFDDDPIAQELTPHLTTVKADPSELGYNAVLSAVNYVINGTLENVSIPSSLICRNSCGCQGNPRLRSISLGLTSDDTGNFAAQISDFLFSKYRASEDTAHMRKDFTKLILALAEYSEPRNIHSDLLRESILEMTDCMADEKFFSFIQVDNLYAVIEYIHQIYITKLRENSDQLQLNQVFIQIYKIIAERNAAYCKAKLDDNHFLMWQTNSITRDMLVFEAYDDEAYTSVVDKLTRLHTISSYLFTLEPAIIHHKNDVWTPPECFYLKSYHNGSEAIQLPPEEQKIGKNELFSNPYLPNDRRYTMVVSPLFSNEEHYGTLMCELNHEYFHYLTSINGQLCAALKIVTLMKQQAKTQRQLQQSLIEIKENNLLLSDLSKKDELTGCFNRRGFFEEVRKKLRDSENEDADAIMVFADLDSLKTINDCFGHEEGDFAIRSAAHILQSSFGEDEIVGRIGGDEFVVCAFLSEPVKIPELRTHIENVSDSFNKNYAADKPYIVHTSVGVYPFKCTDTVEIAELLSHADTLLYEQKKLKKSILKSET